MISNAGLVDLTATLTDKLTLACADSPMDLCTDFRIGQIFKSYLYRRDILHRVRRVASALAERTPRANFSDLNEDTLLAVYRQPANRHGDERGFSADEKVATPDDIQRTKEAVLPSSGRYESGRKEVYTNAFFEHICELSSRHEIAVYTTVTPFFENYFLEYPRHIGEYESFHRLLRYYRSKYLFSHFETYDLARQIDLFSDFQHLNGRGARRFSQEIVENMLANFPLSNGLLWT
jgi:hypothetical protein